MIDYMQPPTLIGTEEAARVAQVDRSTITRWVASGRLKPAHKLPGRRGYYLFALDDVEAAK